MKKMTLILFWAVAAINVACAADHSFEEARAANFIDVEGINLAAHEDDFLKAHPNAVANPTPNDAYGAHGYSLDWNTSLRIRIIFFQNQCYQVAIGGTQGEFDKYILPLGTPDITDTSKPNEVFQCWLFPHRSVSLLTKGKIASFVLGNRDVSDKIQIVKTFVASQSSPSKSP